MTTAVTVDEPHRQSESQQSPSSLNVLVAVPMVVSHSAKTSLPYRIYNNRSFHLPVKQGARDMHIPFPTRTVSKCDCNRHYLTGKESSLNWKENRIIFSYLISPL